jgi:peptide/nickel transport system permease protein
MGKYILRRLGAGLLTLFAISIIIFSVIHLLPGDPIQIMFGQNPNPQLIATTRQYYGLDRPIPVQYVSWLGKVLRGNLGTSIVSNLPVGRLLLPRIGRSLLLTLAGVLISLLIAFPSGIISAHKHNTWTDFSISSISLVLISIPEFWIGILYMMFFAVWLGILPTSGFVSLFESVGGFLKIVFLPALTVASVQAAQTTRMTRATMLGVLRQDYITLMRAMGVSGGRLDVVHAFRNALIPIVTLVGMQTGALLGGVIIVERVFTYPGLGLLMVKAIQERDYPIVQACILVYALLFIVVNIAVDIIYTFINPRVRY